MTTAECPNPRLVIITPAYNEELYIEQTILSVLAQTIRPLVWVIVDDGSTDGTAAIVCRHQTLVPWIQYVFREKVPGQSYYASNVYAILRGLEELHGLDYQFLGILDADIELCADYYEMILGKFEQHAELGIATGTYLEREGRGYVEAKIDRRSTPKAIQVFRRECYEQAGGYIPFKNGGEDSGMEVMARMHGWQTWSFPSIRVIHHRPVGTGDGRSILRARWRLGLTDYSLGTHPLFMVFKCVKRCFWERPYLLSGLLRMLGYLSGYFVKEPCQLPEKAQRFFRREQRRRLMRLLRIVAPDWSPH